MSGLLVVPYAANESGLQISPDLYRNLVNRLHLPSPFEWLLLIKGVSAAIKNNVAQTGPNGLMTGPLKHSPAPVCLIHR